MRSLVHRSTEAEVGIEVDTGDGFLAARKGREEGRKSYWGDFCRDVTLLPSP
jgi:hypothetical protein